MLFFNKNSFLFCMYHIVSYLFLLLAMGEGFVVVRTIDWGEMIRILKRAYDCY